MLLNQYAEKAMGAMVSGRMKDPVVQKSDNHLTKLRRKASGGGHLFHFPSPVINVNGKLQQCNPDRTANGARPQGRRLGWLTSSRPHPSELFAEGKGNMSCAIGVNASHKHVISWRQNRTCHVSSLYLGVYTCIYTY